MKTKITIIASFILLLSASMSFGQKNWGIGLKAGDPTGITVKKYMGKDKSLEFIFGRTYNWYGGDYYSYYYNHDNRFKNNPGYYYRGYYDRSTPIALQVHYLFLNKDIKGLDGLQWYLGVGGQFRYQSFRYRYWDSVHKIEGVDRVSDWGLGPDGVIGLEYTFDDVPLSIALDAVLYMEIIDRPFLFLGQGGLAVRYNF